MGTSVSPCTQVFNNVKYGRGLNKDSNFETFPNSFLVLFQCLTGEGQGPTRPLFRSTEAVSVG
jgi:hypothetical protein